MNTYLTPQQILPVTPENPVGSAELELEDIQGDVLVGLQKFAERFVFFRIADVAAFKARLRGSVVRRITTVQVAQLREFQLRDHQSQGSAERLPLVGVNLGFTSAGMAKLVAGADLGDASFTAGAAAQAVELNDPVDPATHALSTWLPEFAPGTGIDGVFLVAGGTADAVATEAAILEALLGPSITVTHAEDGKTRPGAERGHEHFGWLDGVSQPAVAGLSDPFPGQDLLPPGLFVFGTDGSPPPKQAWMANGSFMVFRRLDQRVPEFNASLLAQGRALGLDPVLLGARMVGRWKSGAPLATTPVQDDPAVGKDPTSNNAFDFGDDPDQRRCPYGAHIRKTNPRKDIPKAGVDPHRILRAGIPFGDEVTAAEAASGNTATARGLLFVCYQTSIANQFEFVQASWANNPGFVFGKVRPPAPTPPGPVPPLPAGVTVGIDPIIGQGAPPVVPRSTDEPVPNYPVGTARTTLNQAQAFIVPRGGCYCFVPSLSALRGVLTT